MNHILTFAIIIFVILCAIVLAKGTSFSVLFSDIGNFIKRLFSKNPIVRTEKNKDRSHGTTGLSAKKQKNEKAVSFIGKQSTEGVQTQITVFDSDGELIGTKIVYIDNVPLLIGRGTDKMSYKQKLCLPDISENPTTSRTHCIITNDSGNLFLQDCYTKETAFDDYGNQIHSVTNDYKTDEYVGNGFLIKSGEKGEVDIGDYVLRLKNLSHPGYRSVPTYGHKTEAYHSTKIAGSHTPQDGPTKRFIIKQ